MIWIGFEPTISSLRGKRLNPLAYQTSESYSIPHLGQVHYIGLVKRATRNDTRSLDVEQHGPEV